MKRKTTKKTKVVEKVVTATEATTSFGTAFVVGRGVGVLAPATVGAFGFPVGAVATVGVTLLFTAYGTYKLFKLFKGD